MLMHAEAPAFASLNQGYQRLFQPNRLTLGLVVPLESYPDSPVPSMSDHVQRVKLAESLGFAGVWLRDIPLHVPSFGDAGQIYDPFVYLGLLAGQTQTITLGVSSIVLPLRHPIHVAKAAASVDELSGGRLVMGVASGDRPQEYPAFDIDYQNRGDRFREHFESIRQWQRASVEASGMAVLPKPTAERLPLLLTGSSQQSDDWLAANGDGWMTYPREAQTQTQVIADYRLRAQQSGRAAQPVMEPLYIDLHEDADAAPEKIHLGYRLGISRLREYLLQRQAIGVNHVALNLRFNRAEPEHTLNQLAEYLLPLFSSHPTQDAQ